MERLAHPAGDDPTLWLPSRSTTSPMRWEELCRTAAMVRAPLEPEAAAAPHREWGRLAAAGALLAAGLAAGMAMHSLPASADSVADADLFSLTNQDRTSNGVAALADSTTLSSIGEAAPYSGCSGAGTIEGRAQDMINRDYFSHQIPPCGQAVWSMLNAYGVSYSRAGENVGWVSGAGSAGGAAQWLNSAFMADSGHRANILDPSFTALGVGSATTGAGKSWTCPASEGCSGTYQNVWMVAEEFAQLSSPAPPPTPPPTPAPTPPPTPPPTAPPSPTSTPRSTATPPAAPPPTTAPSSAPAPPLTPAPAPAVSVAPGSSPSPSSGASPGPSPAPAPSTDASPWLPAYAYAGSGLISATVESTLESILFP